MRISTVLGEIDSNKLGFTTMHEHILCDIGSLLGSVAKMYASNIPVQALKLCNENLMGLREGLGGFSDDCGMAGDIEYAVKELSIFRSMGGNTLVDATPLNARSRIEDLQEASRKSGVNIVCCTGIYITDAQPLELKAKTEEDLSAYFMAEITQGIGDSGVRPGFLKCAVNSLNDNGEIDEAELKAVRACAKAAVETGRSLHIHNAFPVSEDQILSVTDMVLSLGVKPEKLLMLHMDSFIRRPLTSIDYIKSYDVKKDVNVDLQTKLLDLGINIGFDSFDNIVSILPDNNDRIKALVELLRRGYGKQIVLGHDVSDKSRGVSNGYSGYTGFISKVLPVLTELGYQDEIRNLTVENPARILAF
jgi:phosphotriesterase-related protein